LPSANHPHTNKPQTDKVSSLASMSQHFDVLISAEDIAQKTQELAERIRGDYGDEPIVLIGILKGSYIFLADLSRAIGGELEIDFAQTSSYGQGKSSTGIVQIRKDLDINIEGRNVLIVEDIVDTGTTLNHLRELWSTRRPRTLKVCTLLSKPAARKVETPVEYVGFEIPNEFVVGYGLDHGERYRNLPYIAILREG
jgi:hypoxanthine phosphoribosyltransferase